jgi:hypothetical protein
VRATIGSVTAFLATAYFLVLVDATSGAHRQSAAELLESGIYAEETQGDLKAAIDLYRKITATSDVERPVAAQVLLRLGMCYLKGGRAADARLTFEKLSQSYPEQKSIVAKIPDTASQLTVAAERARQIGLFLTRVLRHDPAAAGAQLDPGGWTAIDALLSGARLRGFPIERDEFDEVVRTSDKHRFVISNDATHVRATYGHSVPVDLALNPVSPSPTEDPTRAHVR